MFGASQLTAVIVKYSSLNWAEDRKIKIIFKTKQQGDGLYHQLTQHRIETAPPTGLTETLIRSGEHPLFNFPKITQKASLIFLVSTHPTRGQSSTLPYVQTIVMRLFAGDFIVFGRSWRQTLKQYQSARNQ